MQDHADSIQGHDLK